MRRGCPNDCSNRGVCDGGVCDCVNGFKGPDCSIGKRNYISIRFFPILLNSVHVSMFDDNNMDVLKS